ncbi:MAG: hypothetical protein KC731_31615 [Myxococcales bacterium]|nr:hypothetical protein [Myxococcales bacterium]
MATVVAACLLSVMAIGGVHVVTMLVVALLATVALICSLLLGFGDQERLPIFGPAVLCWCLAAWSAVQVAPLPVGWLAAIAPTNADIWSRALMPLGEPGPVLVPVSLDPAATWIEVLRWFSYGAIFSSSAVLTARHGLRWAASLVFVVALLAGVTTIVHGLLGLRQVYGVYEPSFHAHPWHVGPLLNANNLAGLLNLGAFCGLGLVASRQPPAPRWALAIALAVVLAVSIAAVSRGGIAALFLGLLAYGGLVLAVRRRYGGLTTPARRTAFAATASVVAGVALAALGVGREGWIELLDKDLAKLHMVAAAEEAVPDFVWVGMGRGAFESAYAAHSPAMGNFVMTHAENFPAQWVLEWGLPVGIFALLGFGFWLRPSALRANRGYLAAGVWAGSVALLVQNLADLGLEIPGICIALAVVLGGLWGRRDEREALLMRIGVARGAVPGILIAGAIALVVAIVVVSNGRHDVASDRRRIQAALVASSRPRSVEAAARLRSQLRESMLQHPAEPYFALAGAYLAWEMRDSNPVPWIQRALERSRFNGRAHYLLAHVLRHHGAVTQAVLELRYAVIDEPVLAKLAARKAHAWTRDPQVLAQMVPTGAQAGMVWDALGETAPSREEGAACDGRALQVEPELPGPHYRLALDIVKRAEEGDCHRDDDVCEVLLQAHVAAVRAAQPNGALADIAEARWRAARGETVEAEEELARRCERVDDRVECLRERARLAARLETPERLELAGKALRAAVCRNAIQCAQVTMWLGDLYLERGERGAALATYERALRDQETEDLLDRVATVSSQAGLSSRAIMALEKLLARRGGRDASVEARLKAERQRVMTGILR